MPAVSSYLSGAPCWIDLVAVDRDDARDFYRAVFGWEISEGHATDSPYLIARHGGRTVAGISTSSADGLPPGWTTYFSCANAAATADIGRAHGGELVAAPLAEAGNGAVATMRDPQGSVFGYWQPGRVAGAQLAGEPNSLAGVELRTNDVDVAIGFYGALFPSAVDGTGRWRTPIVGAAITPADGAMTGWWPCFAVRDLDATLASARSAGARIDQESVKSRLGHVAHLTDRQGTNFGAIAHKIGP
jgi:hypothetical protein